RGFAGVLRRQRGVLGDFLGGSAELVDRGSHAAGAAGLLIRIAHRRVGCAHHTSGHLAQLPCRRGHFANRAVDPLDEAVKGLRQCTEFVLRNNGQTLGQVALTVGNVLHRAAHLVQRLHQHADQQPQRQHDDCHGDDHGEDRRGAEFAEHRIGRVTVEDQRHVPVGRRQALHLGERDDLRLAAGLDFRNPGRNARRAVWIGFADVFEQQLAVRVNQNLAVGADDVRVAVATEVQRVDGLADGIQGNVRAGHADHLPLLAHRRGQGHDQLARRSGNVRLGDDDALRRIGRLVPATGTRVVVGGAIAGGHGEHHTCSGQQDLSAETQTFDHMSVSITGDDSDANAVPTGALPPARGLQGKSRHGMKAVSAATVRNLGQL
nr:hypothetical protein [Tanacetum cinerariifolium]